MTAIQVITEPDILHTRVLSFLLIQPSKEIRIQFQNLIQNFEISIHVYLYDPQTEKDRNYPWLLAVSKIVNYTILDVDNLDVIEKNLSSYFISLPNTFYLTNDNFTPYNLLSTNRIYNLDWLYEKITKEE